MKKLEHMTEPEIADLMRRCAVAVNSILTEVSGADRPMFALLVFNDPKIAQYISSCDRATMPTALREAATRIEKRQDVTR